jgi:hypothetical protein
MHKLVIIEWEDSRQPTSSWQLLEEVEQFSACCCISVGYLLSENNGVKMLAANLADIEDTEGIQASGIITIPECCIKRVTNLSQPPSDQTK